MSALYQIISNFLLAIGLSLNQDIFVLPSAAHILNQDIFDSKGGTDNAVVSGQHWNDCLRQIEMFSHPTLSMKS